MAKKSSLAKDAGRILIELLVVFFGAYAAFTLSNFRDQQKVTENRIKFYENFLGEMYILQYQTANLRDSIRSYVDAFEADITAGLRPKLEVNDWSFTYNLLVTKAVFDDGYFSSVGGDFLVNIDMGTSQISRLEKEIDLYRTNTQQLIYFRVYDPKAFYNAEGMLREEYQWYIDDLKSIVNLLDRLMIAIEQGAIPETTDLIKRERE